MISIDRLKTLAQDEARKSDFHNKSRRTGCIIIQRNEIIAKGHNKTKNRSAVGLLTIHAEEDAINQIPSDKPRRRSGRSKPAPNLKGSDVYIFRVGGGISRPCHSCTMTLLETQASTVTFEDENGKNITWMLGKP